MEWFYSIPMFSMQSNMIRATILCGEEQSRRHCHASRGLERWSFLLREELTIFNIDSDQMGLVGEADDGRGVT